MLRLVLSLVALLGLAACGAEPKWAPEEQVQAARFVAGPPTYVTLYTVVNKSTGSGAHSAILVNGSERVIFDPAGTWTHPTPAGTQRCAFRDDRQGAWPSTSITTRVRRMT